MERAAGGYQPPEHISEDEYLKVKDNKSDFPDYYVGYVGFHSTFGAKYFGGYARSFKADGVTPRDQSNEAYRNTMKQVPNILDVNFVNWDYQHIEISNSVIYCDPPYQNTTKYETESFDYEKFWNWCRKMSEKNYVFISEYSAPDDFECIWSKETLVNFDNNRGYDTIKKARTEKLFMHKSSVQKINR